MNDQSKTFIIITPGFPESETDTTCLPFQQKFALSVKENYTSIELVILTLQYPYTTEEYFWNGIRVIPFGGKNRGGLRKHILRRKIFSVLRSLRNSRNIFGLLSFWCGEGALIGKTFGQCYGIPHYCWICGQDARKENKYPSRLNPMPRELIALSDFIQDHFDINHGVRALHVIPPGIDPGDFKNTKEEKRIDILAAGSLIPLKQYDIFISVIAELKNHFPELRAVLAGEGPEKQKLESLVKTYGLEENLSIAGELSHPDLVKLMQQSKIFLHTSSYEGFGVVCIEALYAGAHVISFVKPMNEDIPNWHIVLNKEHMVEKALKLFRTSPVDSDIEFTIQRTTSLVMQLYDTP
jgi:glycosyltransferase involved in cell wall biosynthesis